MRVEVLGGIERRRRWSSDEKMRLVEETLAPGANVSEVARRNGISTSLQDIGPQGLNDRVQRHDARLPPPRLISINRPEVAGRDWGGSSDDGFDISGTGPAIGTGTNRGGIAEEPLAHACRRQ
jgi:Transposase